MPTLETLPTEVLLSITELLTYHDWKNLSVLNKHLRHAVAPSLYRTLKVNCPIKEDHVAIDVVRKYGAYVHELRFDVNFYPNPKPDEDKWKPTPQEEEYYRSAIAKGYPGRRCAPPSVAEDIRKVIHGFWKSPPASVWAWSKADVAMVHDLLRFENLPHCKTLTVHTIPDDNFTQRDIAGDEAAWDDTHKRGIGIDVFVDAENWNEVDRKEKTFFWRAALRDMYRDIATISPTKALKILNFFPKKVSFWRSKKWSAFLGCLERLTLHTHGSRDDMGYQVTKMSGFKSFFSKDLPDHLLRYVTKLRYLEIVALKYGFLDDFTLDFTLDDSYVAMSNVEELHLENMALTGVVSFLSMYHGKRKLSKVRIVNCAAQTLDSSEYPDHPSWANLFSILQSQIMPGSEIEITLPERLLLPDERYESYLGECQITESEDEYEDVQHLRKMLQEDKDFYGWPYVWVCSGSAYSVPQAEVNMERLEMGDDNLHFGLLVDKLQKGGGKCIVNYHICGAGPGSCFNCVYLEKRTNDRG
ncbi:hypothetical protein FLONG3_4671 [Fusarium longipes]|uniref:F-box domain-containing protein n=1 Tax=Fusarium longipes TaxID=694270 RepID=A0A395SY87_9HYPO|nr:hypothetical protein FLONG3_4671 [Fusarium longipes]